MGTDVFFGRDSDNMTPLERAVENYSYETAEFLTSELPSKAVPSSLACKTDSKGIIRLVERVKTESSYWQYALMPLVMLGVNLGVMLSACQWSPFREYQESLSLGLLLLAVAQGCLWLFSSSEKRMEVPNFLALLRAPEFPPLGEICPHCLIFHDRKLEHCLKCGTCVRGFHFHGLVCVNQSNEVFWWLAEVVLLWLAYRMNAILTTALKSSDLRVLHFSASWFFGTAAMAESLW